MRHRFGINTGLGNPDKELLDNKWTGNTNIDSVVKEMLTEGIALWFKDEGGVDFTIYQGEGWIEVHFGLEPAYKHQHLKLFVISTSKCMSRWEQGVAWGPYGSEIARNVKYAHEYKYNSKFRRFVHKWSTRLKEVLKDGAV